jgi:hypothetical protein
MIQSYTAYGLHINSFLPLPSPTIPESLCDVEIKPGKLKHPFAEEAPEQYTYVSDSEMYIHWRQVGTFLIASGKEIIADLLPDVELSRIGFYLINGAMGAILYQRGYLVLHSSAVSIEGNGVAFSARSGAGKSTMAATLHSRGHTFISDDILAIDISADKFPLILPSYPQQKLLPDAANFLGDNPENMPRISSHFEKRHRLVDSSFATNPIPFKHLYVLGIADEIEISPLETQPAVLNILGNSLSAHWSQKSSSNKARASDFIKTTELCKQIGIYTLKRPRDLELMPKIASLIEERALKSDN